MSKVMDTIAKLLAQAEGTDNEHEADAFLAEAQRRATVYSIDLAVARQHTAKRQQRETPIQRTITIGARGKMGNTKLVQLFLAAARANDVTCNIAHNNTYVIAFGFPADIEVAEAIYAHVSYQMVEAANAYLKTDDFREDAYWCERTWTWKQVSARTARLSFYESFIERIGSRLMEAKLSAEAAAIADEADETNEVPEASGTALVLADKKAEVKDFYTHHSEARGSWRGGRRTTAAGSTAARTAGRQAGDAARLTAVPTLPHGKTAIG